MKKICFINLGISIWSIDEGSEIQLQSDVPEVSAVTVHTSPSHSGRDDGKTEKSRGAPEGNSSKNNKDGYSGRSLSPNKDITKRAKRRRRK